MKIKTTHILAGAAMASVVGLACAGPCAAAPLAPLPVPVSFLAGMSSAQSASNVAPSGANDWTCRPGLAHPNPVILLHGSMTNMALDWAALSPMLKNSGYCVFALNYGQEPQAHFTASPGATLAGGTGPIAASAAQLASFVDRVKASTGASKVDIVGHSQGGMMARYYLKFLGGAASVDKLIALVPPNHGSTWDGTSQIPGAAELMRTSQGIAALQQTSGSDFLSQLNSGGDTVASVAYTVISTRDDEIVTPYSSAFLTGPGVVNITVQDTCPQDFTDHFSITYDRLALSYVMHSLDHDYPVAPCQLALPIIGSAE